MIRLFVALASDATVYVPVPTRGVVAGAKAVYQTNAVEVDDTITLSRDTTTVCLITAANTAGLDVETGVPDTTNRYLVFDPDSATATTTVIKCVSAGAAGASLLMIEYDDYAYVEQTATEA